MGLFNRSVKKMTVKEEDATLVITIDSIRGGLDRS
jgi:hypothetical protein